MGTDASVRLETDTLGGDETIVLPEFDAPPADPIELLRSWISAAREHGVREALALALATADGDGLPSSRIVLVKALDERGFVFTSHTGSRKGREMSASPLAAGTLYWRETSQQVNVAGPVQRLSDAESDELFAERPIAARATTAISRQSEPLADESALRRGAERLLAERGALARPDGWGGYRLVFERVEFWHGRKDRLHRRLEYRRTRQGWRSGRLQP